jgi:hypothetical protein
MTTDNNQSRSNRRRRFPKVPLTYYRSARNSSVPASPFVKRRGRRASRARKFIIGIVDIALIGVIIVGLFYSLLVTPKPDIKLSTGAYRPEKTYMAAAENLFRQLKNRNKLSLNEQAIIKKLQAKFPEIASGSIVLPLFSQTPTVDLNISPPALSLKSDTKTFIVDSQGVAVGYSSEFTAIKDLPVLIDQSGYKSQVGEQVISQDAVVFIETILKQCRRSGVAVQSLNLPSKAQELNLTANDHRYYVKFYLGGDPLIQTGQYLAARQQFATGGQPSEYLDVRVPGKIFYK